MKEYNETRRKQAAILRTVRKIHRLLGIFLFSFFIIVGVTGILLGWKKNSRGNILPRTSTGVSQEVEHFKNLSIIKESAIQALEERGIQDPLIHRMDVRPSKGIVKVTFKNNYYGVQVDGTTGEVLQVKKRYSDFIEHLHDGSYMDRLIGWKDGYFKLFYTSILGLALITFSITGFWLWYGPKVMRRS